MQSGKAWGRFTMGVRTGALAMGIGALVAAASPARAEVQIQVYGGANGNFSSDVSYHGTVSDSRKVSWDGKPFEAPPYWGVRGIYWLASNPNWGVALEFTHAKAYAKLNGTAAGAFYDTLEFTDGNNILTGNIMYRFTPWSFYGVRPYAGFGIGVTVPHVEVSRVLDPTRTFEYQLAGFAGQGFIGLEMPFGRNWSGFIETKLSYTHINANLNGGDHLKTDIWSPHFAVGISYRF